MTLHIADGAAQERAKYAEIWSLEEYQRADSPGLKNVDRFMQVLQPAPGATIIDIGCGSGQAGLEFDRLGLSVDYLDITAAGLASSVDRSRFIETPLWGHWEKKGHWHYGFCCDVLEHLPPEYSLLAVDRILAACDTAWLQICNRPDEFGKLIGEPLHLTVMPFAWWLLRLSTLGEITDARDLCGASLFVVKPK